MPMRIATTVIVGILLTVGSPVRVNAATPEASFAVTAIVKAGCRVSVVAIPLSGALSPVLINCDNVVAYSVGISADDSLPSRIAIPRASSALLQKPGKNPEWHLTSGREKQMESGGAPQVPNWRQSLPTRRDPLAGPLPDTITITVTY
jgi:spore coat protein U-like protein